MARKKQEVALQLEINSQEEWEELMQKEGLIVVDVFQDWCGPCKAVLSFFRRIKNEIGDDLLHFATAKCDTIDSLDKYRGRCEPCFLVYGGGALVSVTRGANPPALEELIKSKLEEEHKVMKGEIERKEIKDPYLSGIDVEQKVEKDDKHVEEIDQEVTLALIKPDVVKAGKVDEIIAKLKERGIEILAQQERNLTEDEARSFYHHMENSEFFESLITFLASGPSYVLVLAKGDEGIIHEFRELIGPKVFEEAKETAPDSFRAMYGTNSIENAMHGADDKESAHRELAFFFPDFVIPKIARKKQEESEQQRTLSLIRPAAFAEFKDSILEKIKAAGFKISMQKEVKLTKEEAELFYKEHAGKPYFEELTLEMSKGTLLALALEKQHAVTGFRGILGPKDVEKAKENDPGSLRAQFSKDDITINLIHGSDSEENAKNELKYFFPVEQTIAAIKPDGAENREEIINRILESRFMIVKTVDIVMSKEMAEEFYSDQKDQEYFDDLVNHMQSGPTLFMVLSREDAVRGWRSIMGPKDPNIAAESYPDSIRAVYGKDVKENAVYGSDDTSEVNRVMTLIFGQLEFFENGTLLPQYVTVEEDSKPDVAIDDQLEQQASDDTEHPDHPEHPDQDLSESHKTLAEGEENITIDETSEKETREPEMADQSKTEENLDVTISEMPPTEEAESKDIEQSGNIETMVSADNDNEESQHTVASEHTDPTESKPSQPTETSEHGDENETELIVKKEESEESNIDKVEEPKAEVTEEAIDSTEISGQANETTEVPAADEDLQQEDDSSVLESSGGPMAAGMNPHHDKNEETLMEESAEIDHDKSEETSHPENGHGTESGRNNSETLIRTDHEETENTDNGEHGLNEGMSTEPEEQKAVEIDNSEKHEEKSVEMEEEKLDETTIDDSVNKTVDNTNVNDEVTRDNVNDETVGDNIEAETEQADATDNADTAPAADA